MKKFSSQYAGPGETIPDQPYFKWSNEHKIMLTAPIDPDKPALLINRINRWLGEHDVRRAGWRTPRNAGYQHILASFKDQKTAMLFKLTWAGHL